MNTVPSLYVYCIVGTFTNSVNLCELWTAERSHEREICHFFKAISITYLIMLLSSQVLLLVRYNFILHLKEQFFLINKHVFFIFFYTVRESCFSFSIQYSKQWKIHGHSFKCNMTQMFPFIFKEIFFGNICGSANWNIPNSTCGFYIFFSSTLYAFWKRTHLV